jgi:putative tryptophan/tyrosine transport system substrate-binding protein
MPLIGLAVGLAFALGVASTVTAQPNDPPYRIGLLSAESAALNPAGEAFREGLKALGWAEGQSILIEARFADGRTERLTGLAMDLVRSEVQVIVAGPSTVAHAARRVTATIPIVMAGVGDPIKLGSSTV